MIVADLLILYYYKDQILVIWKKLTTQVIPKFKYKWWIYLLLPIIGILMDFVFGGLTFPIKILLEWIKN